MDKEIKILITGTDMNAYYMSRCYFELTGKKADTIGNRAIPYTSISNPIVIKDFNNKDVFLKSLMDYGEKNKDYKILLVATSDLYVRLISESKGLLEKYYVFNYPEINIVNNLLIKENFYNIYKDRGLDMPKTYIYHCNQNDNIDMLKKYFREYPLIVKPSDGVEYHKLDSEGLAKVYKVKSEEELEKVITKIELAKYN